MLLSPLGEKLKQLLSKRKLEVYTARMRNQ